MLVIMMLESIFCVLGWDSTSCFQEKRNRVYLANWMPRPTQPSKFAKTRSKLLYTTGSDRNPNVGHRHGETPTNQSAKIRKSAKLLKIEHLSFWFLPFTSDSLLVVDISRPRA